MSSIKEIIDLFPGNLQDPMLQFWGIVKEELGVKREDFTELKNIVIELAEAQKELAQAQNRTEQQVAELTKAQNRTEQQVVELTKAQNRTEQRVEELTFAQKDLAEAQKKTEMSINQLTQTMNFKLGGLGKRWGMDSERSFRNGLIEILRETGYEVTNKLMKDAEGFVFGHPSEIEIDLIIIGDKTILVELKASVSKSDVFIFIKKAKYFSQESKQIINKLIIITPFIDDDAKEFAEKNQVVICDTVTEMNEKIQVR